MKKIFIILFFAFVILATNTLAVSLFVNWPDGGVEDKVISQGTDITFNYESFDFNNTVNTKIVLINSLNPRSFVRLFVDKNSFQGDSDSITFSTDTLPAGLYAIYGEASIPGASSITEIDFTLEVLASSNTPPYFDVNMPDYFEYNISDVDAILFKIADYAYDNEGDFLSYNLDFVNTNMNVIDCSLYYESSLFCNFLNVAITTLDVVVNDGEVSVSKQITIKVINNSGESNNPPSWSSLLELNYDYFINESPVSLVDLTTFVTDIDGDAISFSLDESSNNFNITNCFLSSGDLLVCLLNGVGTSSFDVVASDGEFFVPITIFITVHDIADDNNSFKFDTNMPFNFSYPLSAQWVTLLRLSNYVDNPASVLLSYSLDDSNMNVDVADCFLQANSDVVCLLNGVGTSFFDVSVSDGVTSNTQTMAVDVYDNTINHPPYFNSNLSSYFEFPLDSNFVTVFDISHFVTDIDGDALSYSIDSSLSDNNILSCSLFGSVIGCDLNNVGLTSFDVMVSDGEFSIIQRIVIKVYDGNSNVPPQFNSNMPTYFSYPLSAIDANLFQVSNYAFDYNNDILFYSLDTSNIDFTVASCNLDSFTQINCNFTGIGLTTFNVVVSDGEFSIIQTIVLEVGAGVSSNTPPYFDVNMPDYFEYDLSLEESDLLKVSDYVFDEENNSLSISLDTSHINMAVASCTLLSDSTINCVFNGEGITTVGVVVSDGIFTVQKPLLLHIVEDSIVSSNPIAVISHDNGNVVGTQYFFNGLSSYSFLGEYIVSYDWIIKNSTGEQVAFLTGSSQSYSFIDQDEYTIILMVMDSQGKNATSTYVMQSRFVKPSKRDNGLEDGLFVNSLEISGIGFEQVLVNGEILIVATLTNNADETIKNVRMVFTIPELGWKIKSNAITLRRGERENVQIMDYLPDYVVEGIYYPIVSFSNTKLRRSKPMVLEVIN